MKQRDDIELHTINTFITQYNNIHGPILAYIRPCTPPMPDMLCKLNETDLGVEIVQTYGADEEAAMRLGNRQSTDYSETVHLARATTPLDLRALNSLNKVLRVKSTKQYSFAPTWLVIRNAFFLWTRADYEEHMNNIIIPQVHPFDQIWLLFDENSLGKPGIIKLT